MKATDLFIKILENHGVETIYGVPGEENLDFLNSLKDSKIELILTRNEQTAVFMAATYGRFTGKLGVALATLGPGATNMVTGVAYATLGGMPVMVITGQKPIKKSKQGQFQIIDVVSMMKPITKYSTSIVSPDRIPYILNNAFRIAEEERPGAVAIELPEDIAGESVSEEVVITEELKIRRPQIDEKMLEILKTELEKAKKPITLIGAGANRKRISKYLTKFIEKYNIPFFSSQMGKGVVDERLSQYIGTAALTSGDYLHDIIDTADLILSVGYDAIEKPTTVVGTQGTKTIHINFYSTEIDPVYAPYLEVVGDIGNTFWQLDEIDVDNSSWDFDEMYKINGENRKKIEQNISLEDEHDYMMPRRLSKELREVLGDDDILTLDNGLYKVWLARNYPAYKPNTILLDNAFATMGAGVASAMEACRLNPDKQVVSVTGDGGLVMNLGDLETAVRLGIDLVIVILNNNSYGMIKWKQTGAGFENYGLDFGNPDFVKLAESFGAKGYKVENKEDFKTTIENALKEKGIKIIDLDFDYPIDGDIK
ncbi:acetolactate synthase large subunit [Candidatus Gracilibacteria bacterium 28_42_T64]|nr:acetolactate synthase large subunit [Candidatus Gracilibacteria bacterium 28_42_T64]